MIIPRGDRIMIFPHDGTDPPQGYFGVTLGRGHLERGMKISKIDYDYWEVCLDGDQFADPHPDWREAFGRLGKREILLGRKLTPDQYRQLLTDRLKDVLAGRDINEPVDLNTIPVRF